MLIATVAWSAIASAEAGHSPGQTFTLGEIIVTAPPQRTVDIGSAGVTAEAIYNFNRNSLDDAAPLIPGVSAGVSGNSRNERMIFVRGLDRYQVPLSIDGIRVYLPADGRLDYGRFLTPDVAEIQVAKGYASVLDGPGAMGGAVNLVTRKPAKELEVEARSVSAAMPIMRATPSSASSGHGTMPGMHRPAMRAISLTIGTCRTTLFRQPPRMAARAI